MLTPSSPRTPRCCSARHRSKSNPTRIVMSPPSPFPNSFPHNLIQFSVPANCRFEISDAEEDWGFSQPFDYIHARAIVTCFKNNRAILQKIFENLVPGGYFELQDPALPMICDDGTLDGTPLNEYETFSP
jgi:hypothetical protein